MRIAGEKFRWTPNCWSQIRRHIIRTHGFTLVESVLYSGLLAMFLGLAFITILSLLEESREARLKLEVSEGAEFVLAKISWAIHNASAINNPSPGTSSSTLSVDVSNGVLNPIVFTLSNDSVFLKEGGGESVQLINDKKIKVVNLSFTHMRDALNELSFITALITVENEAGVNDPPRVNASTTIETTFTWR